MHYVGILGNPRRYSDFSNVEYLASAIPVHRFMTHAAYFTAAVQILFLINLFWSMKKGPKAPANPWDSTSLEWTIPSPPPFDNFAGVHPVVNHGPYEYAVPGAEKDFVMQTDPATAVPSGD
jgi:cytochrome c oxidase subunit 1